MSKLTITLRTIRKWIAPFADDTIVGKRNSPGHCPIAQMLKDLYGVDEVQVAPHKIDVYGHTPYRWLFSRVPSPAIHLFIRGIDSNARRHTMLLDRYSVTAGEVRALLDAIDAGTYHSGMVAFLY